MKNKRLIITAPAIALFVAFTHTAHAQITVGGNGGDTIDGTSYSGSQSLTKVGTNTVTLSANSNYSGTTFVNAGTLQVNSSGADFTPNNPNTNYVVNAGATLRMGNNSSTAALWGLPVELNGGTLQNNNQDYKDSLGALTMNGGAVTGNAYRVYDGKTWQLSGNNEITTWIGYLTFGGSSPTGHTFDVTGGTTTMSGRISDFLADGGPQFLQKTGSGTLVFSAANTYAGETRIQGGTLQVGSGGASGTLGSGNVVNNATLALNRSDDTIFGNAISGSGVVVKQGFGDVTFTGANTSSGGLRVTQGLAWASDSNKLGSGTITLGDAATGTGGRSDAGLLINNAASTTITNDILVTGAVGVRELGGFNTGNSAANTWTGTMTLERDLNLRAMNTTTRSSFDGKITGAGGINVTLGRVTIGNTNNDYAGATTVNAGTILQLNNNGVIPDASAVNVGGSLYLASGGGTEKIGQLTGSGTIQSHPGVGGNYNLTIEHTGAADFAGTIANGPGAVSLAKAGGGTQTLSGNNTYTGATTVDGGRLVLSGQYASPNFTIANGATLELRVNSGTLGAPTTVYSGTGTLAKTGAGGLVWGVSTATFALGSGSLIDVQEGKFTGGSSANENWTANLSSLNVAAGAIFEGVEANVRVDALTGAGTISSGLSGAGYTNFTFGLANGSGVFSGVLADTLSDGTTPGNFVKAGSGTQVLAGTNTYTGTTTISGGTLQIGNGGTSGTLGSGNVVNNAALAFSRSDAVTVGNTISGTGSLTHAGSGTLTLTSNNTYTGDTTVSGGELKVNGSIASSDVTVNSGAVLSGSGQVGGISGAGSINPGNSPGILAAAWVDPSDGMFFNFEITDIKPEYSQATNSANDVLRLSSATPFTSAMDAGNMINVYFNVADFDLNQAYLGGIFTDESGDFTAMISGADFRYYVQDNAGSVTYNGVSYSELGAGFGIEVTTELETADFGSGAVNGRIMQFSVVPEPSSALLAAIGSLFLLRRRRKA